MAHGFKELRQITCPHWLYISVQLILDLKNKLPQVSREYMGEIDSSKDYKESNSTNNAHD